MAFVASQLIEEVTAHAQSDSLEHAREICADGTYFPNNLRTRYYNKKLLLSHLYAQPLSTHLLQQHTSSSRSTSLSDADDMSLISDVTPLSLMSDAIPHV